MLRRLRKLITRPAAYRRIVRSPDRLILQAEILPVFAGLGGTLLWVGAKRYTRAYPAILERGGAVCWTTDIESRMARWGRPGRDVTADVCRIDEAFSADGFGGLLLNGVFGFGVDTPALQAVALKAMARVLAPGGWLLIGWNTDRTADPLADPGAWAELFAHQGLATLPARRAIPGTTHVYDLLRRIG